MAMSEAQRFELHLGLQKLMGEPMATTFMENVPPSGWSDVAQRSDLAMLDRELRGEINILRVDIERLRVDVDRLDRHRISFPAHTPEASPAPTTSFS